MADALAEYAWHRLHPDVRLYLRAVEFADVVDGKIDGIELLWG
jgi:hypothetical protein